MLDHFGLISPDVLALGIPATIERYRPDFYVGYQMAFGLGGFYNTPAFVRDYELIARVPTAAAVSAARRSALSRGCR